MAKNLILWLVIAVVLMSVFQSFGTNSSKTTGVDYTTFVRQIGQDQIKEVRFNDREITVTKRDNASYVTYLPVANDPKLLDDLINANVAVAGTPPEEPSLLASIFISWFPMLLLIGVWIFFMRQMQGGSKGMGFGKSKAKLISNF